ncbi:hypothetical protein CEXT_786021 [Caerostris extrusa]|uniref:Uncharacterized protein n=1 Tax=Caerostris extrusa TaxID=172846 RepID=A0AAV4VR32_CAEEX|nr:hypothetical protein CEXT_786021 [Caerostris extrusa]
MGEKCPDGIFYLVSTPSAGCVEEVEVLERKRNVRFRSSNSSWKTRTIPNILHFCSLENERRHLSFGGNVKETFEIGECGSKSNVYCEQIFALACLQCLLSPFYRCLNSREMASHELSEYQSSLNPLTHSYLSLSQHPCSSASSDGWMDGGEVSDGIFYLVSTQVQDARRKWKSWNGSGMFSFGALIPLGLFFSEME